MLSKTLLRGAHPAAASRFVAIAAPLPAYNVCIFCTHSRSFTSSPRRKAVPVGKSPTIRRKEYRILKGAETRILSRTDQEGSQEKAKRELGMLLNQAESQKLLPVSVPEAEAIIERFKVIPERMQKAPNEKQFAEVLQAHSIRTLTRIARLVIRVPAAVTAKLGKNMLFAASYHGDSDATVRLIWQAYRQDKKLDPLYHALNSLELKPVRAKLESYADTPGDGYAKVMLAKLSVENGNTEKAIKLCRKACNAWDIDADIEVPAGKDPYEEELRQEDNDRQPPNRIPDLPSESIDYMGLDAPWTFLGLLLLSRSNVKPKIKANVKADRLEAFRAFEQGAFKGDDPEAFWYMTKFEEFCPKHSAKWLEYLTKAAASRIPGAIVELGFFYALPELKRVEPMRYALIELPEESSFEPAVRAHLASLRASPAKPYILTPSCIPKLGQRDGVTAMGLGWLSFASMLEVTSARLALASHLYQIGYYRTAIDLFFWIAKLPPDAPDINAEQRIEATEHLERIGESLNPNNPLKQGVSHPRRSKGDRAWSLIVADLFRKWEWNVPRWLNAQEMAAYESEVAIDASEVMKPLNAEQPQRAAR